jgi:hypothetical protein
MNTSQFSFSIIEGGEVKKEKKRKRGFKFSKLLGTLGLELIFPTYRRGYLQTPLKFSTLKRSEK